MQLRQLIKTDPQYTIAALIHLFGEGREFKCTEQKILKIIAKQYETSGFLSDPQLQAVSRILPKYHDKLQGMKVAIQPPQDIPTLTPQFEKHAWLDGDLIRLKSTDIADGIRTKQLFNRRYSPKKDSYSCQFTLDNLINLKKWGFTFERNLRRLQRKTCRKSHTITGEIDIPGLPGELRSYQKEAVNFLVVKNGRALIADDMGLGKTIQALSYCHLVKEERPILIVTTGGSKFREKEEV